MLGLSCYPAGQQPLPHPSCDLVPGSHLMLLQWLFLPCQGSGLSAGREQAPEEVTSVGAVPGGSGCCCPCLAGCTPAITPRSLLHPGLRGSLVA